MFFLSPIVKILTGQRGIGEEIASAICGYRTVRVAVMGSKRCGKTVLLTSLANHLREHDIQLLNLDGTRAVWDKTAIKGSSIDGMPLFDYGKARQSLAKGEWPEKSAEASVLAMRLKLKDRKGRKEEVLLEILDIPGERVADFSMMGKSYEEWCEWMENNLGGPNSGNTSYREYEEFLEQNDFAGKEEIIGRYKDFLAAQYASFSPCITPSTVKLELDGTPHGGSVENFRREMDAVPAGLRGKNGKALEFVPLPSSAFSSGSKLSKLAAEFGRNYKQYVKRVVRPMEKWLSSTQKLFYLVDVPSLLQAGSKAWNAEKNHGEAAIGALCPASGNSMLERLWKRTKNLFWKTEINAAYVVATKSDIVLSGADRENLCSLADSLFGRVLGILDSSVKTEILSCAAVKTTEEVTAGGKRGLEGRLDREGDKKTWVPSPVPESIPRSTEEWEKSKLEGRFNYQFPFPGFDVAEVCPPPHLGLDYIAREMLSI